MTLSEHDRTLWHIDDVHASRDWAREDLVPPKVSTVPSAVTTSPTRPGLQQLDELEREEDARRRDPDAHQL